MKIKISVDIDGTILPSTVSLSEIGRVCSSLFPILCMVFKHVQKKEVRKDFLDFLKVTKIEVILVSTRPITLPLKKDYGIPVILTRKNLSWAEAREEKIKNIISLHPQFHVDNNELVLKRIKRNGIIPVLFTDSPKYNGEFVHISSFRELGGVIKNHTNCWRDGWCVLFF